MRVSLDFGFVIPSCSETCSPRFSKYLPFKKNGEDSEWLGRAWGEHGTKIFEESQNPVGHPATTIHRQILLGLPALFETVLPWNFRICYIFVRYTAL